MRAGGGGIAIDSRVVKTIARCSVLKIQNVDGSGLNIGNIFNTMCFVILSVCGELRYVKLLRRLAARSIMIYPYLFYKFRWLRLVYYKQNNVKHPILDLDHLIPAFSPSSIRNIPCSIFDFNKFSIIINHGVHNDNERICMS